uniref:SH3 domain-containing protein n=1 Tax=Trichuris muris TaxID=70415 RepID=A0A5S6QXD5_TRIMR
MICSSHHLPFPFQHLARRTYKSDKTAVDKAEGRMQSANDTESKPKEEPNRHSECAPPKNAAHKRWKKLFKVFKVSQAFLDLNTKAPASSDEETNSTDVAQTEPAVDPTYMALKRAQLMATLKGEQFSRSLDLDADLDDDVYGEPNTRQSPVGPKPVQDNEQTRPHPWANHARTTPPDLGGQANEEEQACTTVAVIQNQALTKAQETSSPVLKLQVPLQSKPRNPGRPKQDRTGQGIRARSQPPAFKDESKKATKREKKKMAAAAVQKSFDRHHCKVPPLKKLYAVMQEKEAAFDEKMKSRKRRDISKDTYAVIHEFRAKFPGELDLRLGDRLTILDNRDPDWWTGCKGSEPCGRFPSTSVERIRLYEQILQVKQNLQLWDDKKKLRVYRDQIVFGQRTIENGFITIRTASNHYINCPVQHLLLIK